MRRSLLLPVLGVGLFLAAPLRAQTSTSMDLAGPWKFSKGDNKSYATAAFDDTLWKDVSVPSSWQVQGNPELKGFAWYRKHITLPAEWDNNPLIKADKAVMYLDLGQIADAYEIYWNGAVISAGGKFPPAFAAATDPIHVGVPVATSNFGGDNVLAVRVYSNATASGIVGGPLTLREPTFADFLGVSIVGKNNQTEFTGPEGITFDLVVENQGSAAWNKGTVMITMLDGGGKTILTSPMMVDVNPQKQFRATMQLKEADLNPGVYTILAATQMGGVTMQTTSKVFVFNPGGIRCATFKTADQLKAFTPKLDAFWKTTIAALKNAPIGGSSTLDSTRSTDKVTVYKVTFDALNGQTIYGWLAVPASTPKSPGVVVLPGYGNTSVDAPTLLAENGFAALAINVMGSDVNAKTYPSEMDAYAKGGFNDPNTFVMRSMVSAGLRAFDYLAQRPEVNANRLGVIGMSQGGGLALDVAALDPRINVVVASSPAADFTRMFAQATSNPVSPLLSGFDPTERMQLDQTMAYFDPAFLAARIRVPTMITIGMKDAVSPPETAYAVKNAIPQGVAVSIVADEMSGHMVTPGQASASLGWLKKFLVG